MKYKPTAESNYIAIQVLNAKMNIILATSLINFATLATILISIF